MTEVSAKLFDALERISEAKTDDEFLAAANHLAALRRELIANDVSGKEAKYPAGLPKKYQPVADELARMGYRCDSCRNNQADFARITLDAVAKNGDIEIVALYDKVCGIGFDILDTPWWASVQKRKEQEFQAAVNERIMLSRITAAQKQMDVARQEMERLLRMRSETICLVDAKTTADVEAWMRGEARKP
jgi:hypothetical protein